jgi:hypothetical protein
VVAEMNIKLCSLDLSAFGPPDVEVVIVQVKLLQFSGEVWKIQADVEQRADKHVSANAAEEVEIECFHKPPAQREFI